MGHDQNKSCSCGLSETNGLTRDENPSHFFCIWCQIVLVSQNHPYFTFKYKCNQCSKFFHYARLDILGQLTQGMDKKGHVEAGPKKASTLGFPEGSKRAIFYPKIAILTPKMGSGVGGFKIPNFAF